MASIAICPKKSLDVGFRESLYQPQMPAVVSQVLTSRGRILDRGTGYPFASSGA